MDVCGWKLGAGMKKERLTAADIANIQEARPAIKRMPPWKWFALVVGGRILQETYAASPAAAKRKFVQLRGKLPKGAHVLPSTGKNKLEVSGTCAELADMWAKLKRLPPGAARAFADDLEGSRFALPEAQWVAFKAALDAPAKDIPALRRLLTETTKDEDGVWVSEYLPIPGCVSQGKTRKESLRNLQKAIKACRAARRENKGAVGECG